MEGKKEGERDECRRERDKRRWEKTVDRKKKSD